MEALLAAVKEVQEAKNARKVAKGSLTRVANQLKKNLVLEPGVKYDCQALDKFSIKTDAEKLAANLQTLQTANEHYFTVSKNALIEKNADEEFFTLLEEQVDTYWTEARREATVLLNLYNFEYQTSLECYLKNIKEERKVTVTTPPSTDADIQKKKKKTERDIARQVNRWTVLKAQWVCIIEQAEKDTEATCELSDDDLLKHKVLIDADSRIKELKDQWDLVNSFQETLWELLDSNDFEQKDAEEKVNFDAVKEAQRMHCAVKQLERISVAMKNQILVSAASNKAEVKEDSVSTKSPAPLKLDKIKTPKFSGKPEDYAAWKERFCALVPTGREEAETCVLLEQSVPENKRYLLRGCGQDYKQMLEVLQKELAPTRDVVNSINLQLSKLKKITPDDRESDKRFVQMVEALEKMERDLKAINRVSAIANCNVIQDIECKLPHLVKTDWLKRKRLKALDEDTDEVKFYDLMEFLKDFKYIAKDGVAEYERAKANNSKSYTALVTGQCLTISSKVGPNVSKKSGNSVDKDKVKYDNNFCLACQDGATDINVAQHDTYSCDHWSNLSLAERRKLVKCEFHPRTSNHTTKDCKFKKPRSPCKFCKSAAHHSLFCLIHKSSSNLTTAGTVYVSELPNGPSSLQSPVLLPFVYANVKNSDSSIMAPTSRYSRLGVLTDNCATDTWITFDAADKMGLEGQDITISAGGFGGKRDLIASRLYSVYIKTKGGDKRIECLGVQTIGNEEALPNTDRYSALCKKFQIKPRDVKRPVKIDMLIGQRGNYLHPDVTVKTINGMRLLDGPLGKTLAGVDNSGILGGPSISSNFFTSAVIQQPIISIKEKNVKDCPSQISPDVVTSEVEASILSKSLLCSSSRDFLDYFKMENVGVDCQPRCGNCSCGFCAIGGKLMSIKEEREYEVIRSNLKYDPDGTINDPGPYWRSSLPWEVDRRTLGDNKSVVLGTLKATLRKLGKDPSWRRMYEDQLRVLIENGFARKVSDSELASWVDAGKKIYFISHQIVVVPENKTTPVRVVFNSSQKYMGKSLNSCLALGPEIMNNLQGILLRFREHRVAAAGDIKKMFYCVRVNIEDQMCQLWCHQFENSSEIETFCMTRLVMGNRPSTSISGVAVKETTKLDNFATQFPAARQALDRDSYVDNTNVGAENLEQLQNKIEEIEYVAAKGGFMYKPWTVSGTKSEDVLLGYSSEDGLSEKNLGVLWLVTKDCLQIKPKLCFSSSKRDKQRISVLPFLGDIEKLIPLKLRLRDCLSVHAGCFDPLGMVLPVKMYGNLLFRISLQLMKTSSSSQSIPWDMVVSRPLLDKWLSYFSMLDGLKEVTFPRTIKPENVDQDILPDLITFSDGNEAAFGTVSYVRWTLKDGTRKASMFISKAKLAPLNHKGEVVKNELSAATYSARLKIFILQESCLKFGSYVHFLDSQIVQFMMKKDSYGYNTFAGLRVSELQRKTDVLDWLHISSESNIADILTKGTTPDKIGPGSPWQEGPPWLSLDKSLWPVTEIALSDSDHEKVSRFISKSKLDPMSIALNSNSGIIVEKDHHLFDQLLEKSGSLEYALRIVAVVRRAVRK